MSSSLASFEYLERLPGTTFKRLYQQPSTALAIFRRMLPHLAKTFVMSQLYMSRPLLLSDLDLWMASGSKKVRDEALAILTRLHMITVTAQNPQTLVLTKNFQQSLRLALTGGGDHQSFGVPSSADVGDVTIENLDEYARNQWEGILQYVVSSVGGGQATSGPTAAVKQLLEAGSMVTRGRNSSGITQAGFTFLLQEVNAQVWTLLLLWMENAETMGMDSVELLAFFFLLGSLELGRGYSTTNLTKAQEPMLANLVDFGLVYIPESTPHVFFPTRLATTLSSDAGALRSVSAGFDAASSDAAGKGFIVIETNYRLYAYTNSPLQIAVLALFTKLNTRYPNMVTGKITRDSMYNAISRGITSDQVISFLSTHAHPQLVKKSLETGGGLILPPTVVDQIRLWQLEKERMKVTPGFVFKDFETSKEYSDCVKYADENGVLLWKNDKTKMFFVTRVDQISLFIKSRKAKKNG